LFVANGYTQQKMTDEKELLKIKHLEIIGRKPTSNAFKYLWKSYLSYKGTYKNDMESAMKSAIEFSEDAIAKKRCYSLNGRWDQEQYTCEVPESMRCLTAKDCVEGKSCMYYFTFQESEYVDDSRKVPEGIRGYCHERHFGKNYFVDDLGELQIMYIDG